jgi:hypothetical protein
MKVAGMAVLMEKRRRNPAQWSRPTHCRGVTAAVTPGVVRRGGLGREGESRPLKGAMMDLELADKVVVVTGANKGIGLVVTPAPLAECAYGVAGSLPTENLDGLDRVIAVPAYLVAAGGRSRRDLRVYPGAPYGLVRPTHEEAFNADLSVDDKSLSAQRGLPPKED